MIPPLLERTGCGAHRQKSQELFRAAICFARGRQRPAQSRLGHANGQELCRVGLQPASADWKPAPPGRGHRKRIPAHLRGQSTLEFGLSSLLLLLLMFGVFEMSRMLLIFTTVNNAARAGARFAIVHGADNPPATNQIQTLVKGYLSAAPMNTANPNLVITVSGAGGTVGSTVSVSVTYPYDPFIGFYTKFFGSTNSFNISSTTTGVITW